MKASDYIVRFLKKQGITDVFGYPGGMVTHLMESFDRCEDAPRAHICYHEQGCAMAACGWAEITGLPGVAYATSGPGATNLLTGIACAYFESLPAVFITGQVNTYEQKGELKVRQRGFQETDIVSIAKPVTKLAMMVSDASELPAALELAFRTAMEGRRGPVLLDIPMNVQRGDIPDAPESVENASPVQAGEARAAAASLCEALRRAKRPVILAGHGVALAGQREHFRELVSRLGIPVVTSMIAVDALAADDPCNFGFIGAYGARHANWIVDHCDLLLTLGSRLDCRQTGVNKSLFAPDAEIWRVDVDPGEMTNRAGENENQIALPLEAFLPELLRAADDLKPETGAWMQVCAQAKKLLCGIDTANPGNGAAHALGELLAPSSVVVTDVGQNQVWVAQSMAVRGTQRVLFSGGHGAMGYALPAAVGAALAAGSAPVICCTGDGGLQMNVQELQTVMREQLPVKVVLFNNHALGMIHHFQEMYFDSNYVQTDAAKGFTTPDFAALARAYGLRYARWDEHGAEELRAMLADDRPLFVEMPLPQTTHVFPKLGMNKPIHEQEPPVPAEIFERLDEMLRSC